MRLVPFLQCTAAGVSHRAKVRLANKDDRAEELARFGPVLFAVAKTLEADMDGIIYLVGLIVIVMAILSFFGLR